MPQLFGGQRCADEADPEHQMAQQGIGPEDRGLEEISQYYLQKGQQNHAEQNDNEQDDFDFGEEIINEIDDFHFFPTD